MTEDTKDKNQAIIAVLKPIAGIAGLAALGYSVYIMVQVWGGAITTVPLIGELTYPSEVSGLAKPVAFFQVALAGLLHLLLIFMLPFTISSMILNRPSSQDAIHKKKRIDCGAGPPIDLQKRLPPVNLRGSRYSGLNGLIR